MKNIRIHVFVRGRVQGVFFRDSTQRKAVKLGVTGWVKNLEDGRVEAVFDGDEDAVGKMLEFVHIGPAHAKVISVDISYSEPRGEFETFVITG